MSPDQRLAVSSGHCQHVGTSRLLLFCSSLDLVRRAGQPCSSAWVAVRRERGGRELSWGWTRAQGPKYVILEKL